MADYGRLSASVVEAFVEAAPAGRLAAAVVEVFASVPDPKGKLAAAVVEVFATDPPDPAVIVPGPGLRHWLLLLDFGGRVYRFADEGLQIARENGQIDWWDSGLQPLAPGRSATETGVSVVSAVDWAREAARGLELSAGTATLYRWRENTTIERAERWLAGRIDAPEWGGLGEALDLQIAAEPWRDRAVLPAATATISAATWPLQATFEIPEISYGRSYPILIGCPGAAGFDGLGSLQRSNDIIAGSPAYLAEWKLADDDSRVLVAGHEIVSSHAWIFDATAGTSERLAIQHTTDLLGRTVAFVDFNGAITLSRGAGQERWAALDPSEATWGGAWNRDRTAPLRRAGEVISFLLLEASRITGAVLPAGRVDRGRQEAQRAYLDRYLLDFAISSSCTIAEFVSAHLAPILPIEWVEGANGGYWLAWRLDAQATDAVADLSVERRQITRRSRIRGTEGDRYTRYRLDFARAAEGTYRDRLVLYGDLAPGEIADTAWRQSWRCQVAQAQEARRSGSDGIVELAVETDVVQDAATAALVLDGLAARYAFPPLSVQYEAGPDLEALQIGDVVLISDAEVFLDRRVALVRDVTLTPTGTLLDLDLLSDPRLVRRETS